MEEIFAIVWCDFIPLCLKMPDKETAISKAQEMHARSELAGIKLRDLRAVHLPANSEIITTLWLAPENPALAIP